MGRKRSRGKVPAAPVAATALVPVARYDAAGNGRRLSGWRAPSSGPNVAMAGAEVLRNRMRDAIRNEWAARSNHRVWHVNLIGTGIVPRPRTRDRDRKARLKALWERWAPCADADGVLDFYGLQTLAVKTWLAGGECFVRLRPRRLGDGLEVPLQVQLYEGDMVPFIDRDLPDGNRIRSGIEFDRIGRRVAVWMYRAHPGDKEPAVSLADLVQVPAEQVLHIFEPERPGQIRGVIDFASVLAKLRSVGNFDDAVLTRQELANLFTMFVTRSPSSGGNDPIDPMTGRPYEMGFGGGPMASLEPGMAQEMAPGEDVKFSDPPDAGANYAEFMRQQHLGVSAGGGVPYEFATGDIRDVSDRVLRVLVNEFHRHCEQRQWQILIPQLCQKVRDAWARAALLAGAIAPAELDEARSVIWSPQGWAYMNPTQDVAARVQEVEAGLKARGQAIGERGEDPDEVDAQRAEDTEREQRLGLPAVTPSAATAAVVAADTVAGAQENQQQQGAGQ